MNQTITLPSTDALRLTFSYDENSGALTNKITGYTYSLRKYSRVTVNGIKLLAHRVIWKLMTGEEPKGVIDHINNNPSDNRWENLQDIPERMNVMKDKALPIFPPNSTSYPGSTKWVARGSMDGVKHYQTFVTECEAIAYAEQFRAVTLQSKSV